MRTVPVINCTNASCFKKKLADLAAFLPDTSPIHVDIAKKPFASIDTFPGYHIVKSYQHTYHFAAHCMVPMAAIMKGSWFGSAYEMLYFHYHAVHDWEKVVEKARVHHQKIGVVFDRGDLLKDIRMPKGVHYALVLAVHPGKAHQKFHAQAIRIITLLKKEYPHVTITVDGGITPEVARLVKTAGADMVVSSSYIWNAEQTQRAYNKLASI